MFYDEDIAGVQFEFLMGQCAQKLVSDGVSGHDLIAETWELELRADANRRRALRRS